MTQLYELNELACCIGNGGIREALADMAAQRITERIWARDFTVWRPVDVEISNRLGWLRIAGEMGRHLERLTAFVRQLQDEGYTHAVLLGMGGSSLAPELFRKTFPPERGTSQRDTDVQTCGVRPGFLDLAVLDSTDPGAVLSVAEGLDLFRTLFIVSTKSGGTVETLSFFKYFYNRVADAVGPGNAGAHFVAITDPGASLADLAGCYHFRATFLNDPTIGGRYSALSYFGLVAAALIGMDLRLLLERGIQMGHSCGPEVAAHCNPAAHLGVIVAEAARAGCDKLTFLLSPALTSFGDWVEQLVAESTGKEGQGILPVVGEPLGAPALYASHDRLFIQMRLESEAADDDALQELEREGQPVVQMGLRDLYDVGAQFFLWEMATAVAGHRLGINPFDQPDVEAAKKQTREVMAAYRAHGALPAEPPTLVRDGIAVYATPVPAGGKAVHTPGAALDDFLAQAQPRDYVALHAYVQPTPATDAALQALRLRLRDRLHLATTLGYGPRFLHSTGQLHKGDANRGLFIQITAQGSRDVPIPDEAGQSESSITFGVLKMAQALGDRRALHDAGRRVIRFHLDDVVGGLDYLTREL